MRFQSKALILSLIFTCASVSVNAAVNVLFAGNSSGRVFTIDDLTDGDPSTEITSGGFDIFGLAWVQGDQTLYAINNSRLFTIDTVTGAKVSINSSTAFNASDMAYDSVNSVMYGANDTRFFSIDLVTGNMTSILNGTDFTINSMAYDASTDTLYGGNSAGRFYSINRTTGAYTSISTGGFANRGMAFDPIAGTLYAGNSSNRFFEINPLTGANIDLGGGTGATEYDVEGLTFVPESSTSALLMGVSIIAFMASQRRSRS